MPCTMIRSRVKVMATALCGAFYLNAGAQTDTLLLGEVEVLGDRFQDEVAGVDIREYDTDEMHLSATTDLGQWLSRHSGIPLRSYGPGGSVGLSIRGSSTSQTQVLINGIPFENPGLASADLSLLPVAAFSEVSVYRGSAAAYLGNAAIGGSLLLNSPGRSGVPHAETVFTAGSFGRFGSATKLSLGDDRFSSSSVIGIRSEKNDFLRPDPHHPEHRIQQDNGFFRSKSWAQNFAYNTKRTLVRTFLWVNDIERGIPPSGSRATSEARQKDQNIRLQTSVKVFLREIILESAVAFDRGVLNYVDPRSSIDDQSQFTTSHFRLKASRSRGNTHFFLIANYRESKAMTATYSSTQLRKSPSLVGGATTAFFQGRTEVSLLGRQELMNSDPLPFLPVLSLAHRIGWGISLSGSAGRSYRLPGLNDLYWNPGGNSDLLPESGWFQEIGLHLERSRKKYSLQLNVTGFHRVIENWILWRPGPTYWSPENIRSVETWGAEAFASLLHDLAGLRFAHSLSGTLVESVGTLPAFEGDGSVGKQLIYLPRLSLFASEKISSPDEKIEVWFLLNFAGRRFTTSDNSRSLDPYLIFDVELAYNFRIPSGDHTLSLFGAVRNVFDTDYQLQASHYMPGTYFDAGVKLRFDFKSQTQ